MIKRSAGFILVLCILTMGACASQQKEPLEDPLKTELSTLAIQLTTHLFNSEYDAALSMMDDKTSKTLSKKIETQITKLIQQNGDFIETALYTAYHSKRTNTVEFTLNFEKGAIIQQTVFNEDQQVTDLKFLKGAITEGEYYTKAPANDANIPDTILEEPFTVEGQSGYPLKGALTYPVEGDIQAAVVLIHDFKPTDMDGSMGDNKPFRDLAYGLSQHGFAVLRYDKKTFAHQQQLSLDPNYAKFSVNEDFIWDAVAAVRKLKTLDSIPENQVYLLGHGLSGAFLPYISKIGAECSGYILMAATPRKLWEITADQYLLDIQEYEQNGDTAAAEELRLTLEETLQKASLLSYLSDEAAQDPQNSIFNIPAWYLRSMAYLDPIPSFLADEKPVLVLQGEQDRQVFADKDYVLWEIGLSKHPAVTMKRYPQLNHLMSKYSDDNLSASDFSQYTPVDDTVINDIIQWLKSL